MVTAKEITVSKIKRIGAMAFILPVLEKLRIREVIDHLCRIRDIATYSVGEVVEILIMNRLIAPQPLYEVGDWMKGYAVSEYYSKEQECINDDKIARTLDKLHEFIPDIESKISINAIETFGLDITSFHYDITSISFEGAYEKEEADEYINIVHGYSRDRRPDLKQATLGMDITHEHGVPLVHKTDSGNVADVSTYVDNLERIRQRLGIEDPILIHDKGMVSGEKLIHADEAGAKFICSYSLTAESRKLLRRKIKEDIQFELLCYRPQYSKNRFRDQYYGIEGDVKVVENKKKKKKAKGTIFRLVFIKSDEKEKKDKKKRGKNINKIKQGLERIKSLLNKYDYKTISYVERRIGELLCRNSTAKYFKIDVTKKKGLLSMEYNLSEDFIEEDAFFDGIYTLATNLDKSQYSADEVLKKYKGLYRVESRFRNLKSHLKVSPIFLHSEKRIESLLFVIFLSLMIYALVEKVARNSQLPEYKRMTTRVLLKIFENISLTYIHLKAKLNIHEYADLTSNIVCHEIKKIANLSPSLIKFLQAINFKLPAEYFER